MPAEVARSSSIPRVKARLFELLTDLEYPGARPVVTYGWPRDLPREIVMLGALAESSEQEWVAFGARKRDEEYRLRLVLQAAGATQQAATERAFALLAVIEEALRADPNLGLGAEIIVAEIAAPRLEEAPDPDGYVAAITGGIAVRARI